MAPTQPPYKINKSLRERHYVQIYVKKNCTKLNFLTTKEMNNLFYRNCIYRFYTEKLKITFIVITFYVTFNNNCNLCKSFKKCSSRPLNSLLQILFLSNQR